MATNQISIGNAGLWRIIVDQVSQNAAALTSQVRVRGVLENTSGVRSYADNVSRSIYGTKSWSGSGSFDVGGGATQTFIDQTFTVEHNSDGTKSVSFGVTIGSTGTFTFGNGGSVTTSLTLTPFSVSSPPGKVTGLSRSFDAPTTVNLAWDQPSSNGATIVEYEVQADDNSSFSSPASRSTSARSYSFTGRTIDTIWWFRVRARNSEGWGPWSAAVTYAVPGVPSKIGSGPALTYTPPDTIGLLWGAPTDDGGANLTGYEIQYWKENFYANAVIVSNPVSNRKRTISGLEIGARWYFRVRAKNSQGVGPWSNISSYLVVCGPRVRKDGVYKNTVAYVKVNGVWSIAIPYVKISGAWTVAGG